MSAASAFVPTLGHTPERQFPCASRLSSAIFNRTDQGLTPTANFYSLVFESVRKNSRVSALRRLYIPDVRRSPAFYHPAEHPPKFIPRLTYPLFWSVPSPEPDSHFGHTPGLQTRATPRKPWNQRMEY